MASIDVVISGISGRFPGANNIEELGKQLLVGECFLKPAQKWNPGGKESPKNIAETREYEKFDYTFFGMHSVLASLTDPNGRVAIEIAFEAIVDAGINPTSLRGSNTHVYSGITQFESDCAFDILINSTGYAIMGRNRCMVSNRISYFFGLTGRSCSYDGMCGWVGDGLKLAREAIQSGECDTAIVLGLTLSIFLSVHKNKHKFGLLSQDSELHPFDDKVGGYGRGDAQIAFVVQRADIAKRSYGSIVLAASESQGSLPNWFLSVDEDHLRKFVSSEYHKNKVDPSNVQILEADGLCNKDMVESELKVLDEVLNAGRSTDSPLYLGTVKTMLGESEGAGGLASLTKLILALETGIISPTINCGKLNPNIKGLSDGRFKVVTEPTKLKVTPDTIVAVSSLSYNGVVSHVALKANGKKKKTMSASDCPLPYLILISGRNTDVVEKSLQRVSSSSFDPEYLRLTQEVFSSTIHKFEWRGYGFHGKDSSQKFIIQRENRRPVWFVYSGMGSQWARCAKDLMLIPIIRETLKRLHNILEPKGVNLLHIVAEADDSVFDNILNSFVCITAIQIALTNLMQQLGIVPDGIIGHSVGELGCSYADGCLTEEQTILASYARGVASLKANLIPGLMAAVGIGGDEAQKILPPEVVVACRNSSHSCTISGPAEDIENVVKTLSNKGIFVRKVNVANIAYHSPYIKPAAPYLLSYLQEVITTPKLRSPKWVCTSAPEERWDTDEVRYCSAQFHTNNLLSSVYFQEGAEHIPKNALVIELAPHGLLQAILTRSLGVEVAHVPLTRRGASSPSRFLLEAVGKLFLEGLSPKLWHFYPEVSMPVSRNTPSLVPLLAWEHEDDFKLQLDLVPVEDKTRKIDKFSPSMEVVGTDCLLPAHILVMTWASFAVETHRDPSTCPVVFNGVHFHDVVKLKDEALNLTTFITQAEGRFECFVNDTLIANGKIRLLEDDRFDQPLILPCQEGDARLCLDSEDVYSELKSKCVGIPDEMKTIRKLQIYPQDWIADVDFSDGDWSRLLNSLLMMFQLRNCEGSLCPASVNYIQRLVIDPSKKKLARGSARLHLSSSSLIFDGVEIYQASFKTIDIPDLRLEPASHQFVPFGRTALKSEESFLLYTIQLCLEKSLVPHPVFKILDLAKNLMSLSQKLQAALHSKFHLKSEVSTDWRDISVILCDPASIPSVSAAAASENILILSEYENHEQNVFNGALKASGLRLIAEYQAEGASKRLVACTNTLRPLELHDCKVIKMGPEDEVPLSVTNTPEKTVILVWGQESRKSPGKIFSEISAIEGAEKLRLVFLVTPDAPTFSLDHPFYSEQLQLNVPVNVYYNGKWGNYRVIPVKKPNVSDSISDIAVESPAPTNGIGEVTLRCIGLNREERFLGEGVVELSKGVRDFSGEYAGNKRIMGVASFDNASSCYFRDPILMWPIPDEWTYEEAATVPCAYSFAFFVLFEVARLQPKESTLITCPFTPVGQAAIRIALSLECNIHALVESTDEKNQLQNMFPNLRNENIIVSCSETFQFYLRRNRSVKINVILCHLSGWRLEACAACLTQDGRMVMINSKPMHARDYIGLEVFVNQVSLYGASVKGLSNAPPGVKERVKEWLQRGLAKGIVKPNKSRKSYATNEIHKAQQLLEGDDVTKRVVHLLEERRGSNGKISTAKDSQSIIIGGSQTQLIKLAYFLARKVSKRILVAPEHSSHSFFARHVSILRSKFDADLSKLTIPKSGSGTVKEVAKSGPIEAVFVFEHNAISENIIQEIHSRNLRDVQLVFLSKESTFFTRMSELWVQDGFKVKAAVGVDDIPLDRLTPMLDWLLSSSSPTVSDLSGQIYSVRRSYFALFKDKKLLPTSAAELVQFGASIRGKTAPVFKEVTTRCTCAKVSTEIKPLFYIKGIHRQGISDLETIASHFLAPMFEVALHDTADSLEATAEAVVQGILKIQTNGPFNLAGDSIRTDLTLRVARILERRGFACVVFLKDEHINDIREELSALQNGNTLSSSILTLCLSEDGVTQKEWKSRGWSRLSWEKQVSAALSKICPTNEEQKANVMVALKHIKLSLEHILEGQDIALKYGVIHSIKTGDDFKEYSEGERRHVHIVPALASNLSDKKISEIFSANLATPVLQLNFLRSKGKDS